MFLIKKKIAEAIYSVIADKASDLTVEAIADMLEYPPDTTMGDIAFPCFKLSKALRAAPPKIAADILASFSCECVGSCSQAGGYLNMKLSDDYLSGELLSRIKNEKDYGSDHSGDGKVVTLDYSSPNICKPFHIGHLGSTIIGQSLKNIHEFCGWKAIGINHLGDWGTQFGKQITAYKLWGDRETIEKGGVDALVALYVRFHEEAEKDPSLNDRAREEFHLLETGNEENVELWKWFVSVSLAEFNRSYERLGISFDSYAGESFYTDKMDEQVQALRDKGMLKLDDGASIVDLSEYNMPPCLILKRDGSTLYPTRDIAAAVWRKRNYNFDRSIYVTAAQQCLHFAQWFKVVELMGYDWSDELVHVPYGLVSINGAKLATRTGNVILIKDLIDAAVGKASEIMKEKNPELAGNTEIADAVGIGAIVYHYLSGARIKDIDFRMEEALSFDGNTGPYAQYTYARCCSVLEKAQASDCACAAISADEERELLKTLARFPEKVQAAIREFEPSDITRYIFELASSYNRFYHECRILSAEDEKVKALRLSLTEATKKVLGQALELICMKHPEKI